MKRLPNDIEAFLEAAQPCKEAVEELRTNKPVDGGRAVKDMADGWNRTINGMWLEWILGQAQSPDLEKLQPLRLRRFAPLLQKAMRTGDYRSSAFMKEVNEILKDYADDIRATVKNPFEEK